MAPVLPSQMPPRIFSAEEVIPVTKTILRERCTVRNTVSQTVTLSTACFENVIKPLIDVDNRTQGELGVIAMLRYASPEQAAREASEEAVRLIGRSESEFTSREDLYLIIKAVKDKAEKLDFEAAKYLDSTFKDFTRCGHGILDRDQIKYYLDKRNEIDSLRRKFTQNVRDEDGGLWFSLEELDGVSEQDLSRFLEVKEPNKEGMRFVRFRRAEVDAIMRYARNPAMRKKMYVADASKLTQNIDLFKEVLVQRDGNARLLGYASHAAFRLEKRVAKSPDWVDNFLDGLEEVLIPQGKREMQALLERKRIYLIGNTDYPQEYHTKHEKISEYFPMRNTVSAMLELFTSYLQLRFVPLPPELMVGSKWHEDVEAWSVWDEREESKGAFVGYLYADLLWRPNKYQGSQNVNLQCGYAKDDGTRVYPATILMCSFPRSTPSGCALLKHQEIVSLFHELGHGIHDLLSRTSYVKFHGHRAPPDFAEAPSVMLENWCWLKDELKQMSCHYTKLDHKYLEKWQNEHAGEPCPPEKIPDEMLDSLIESRDSNRALWFLKQLALSRFDMAVHNAASHEECVNLNPTELYNNLMETLQLLPNRNPRDRGHPHADFGHLLSGFDAGYYSYLSAHVFAADMFQTIFAENPRSQAAWEKYRRGILEYGGSRDELGMLEEFLGHRPSPESLLHSLKLLEK